jgi:aspartate 1-decarboxylase
MTTEVVRTRIHRVTVKEADPDYIGSITIDKNHIDVVGLVEGGKVQMLNVNNGARSETHVIKDEHGSGIIRMNGPAAHKLQVGHDVIIVSYADLGLEEARAFRPSIINPDETTNRLRA